MVTLQQPGTVLAEDRRRRAADPIAPRRPDVSDPAPRPRVRPGRLLAGVLAVLFYALGWLAGVVLIPVLFAVHWAAAAVATGWSDAGRVYARGRGTA